MPTVRDRLDYLIERHSSYKTLALALSKAAGKTMPWTENYIVQVHRRKLKASKRLLAAVKKHHQSFPNVYRPPTGTWVPWRSKDEQEFVQQRLTAADRREVLLAAAKHKEGA